MKILVVEDERLLADSLCTVLRRKGFEVEAAYQGDTGAAYAALGIYDLLILDVMLPGLNGYDLARQVRAAHSGVPILMLTAKAEVHDRVAGLNAGADYYLTKPFDMRELLACVHALLRRQGPQVDTLCCGNTTLELTGNLLRCGGSSVRLSAKEYDLMRALLQAGCRTVPKEVLLTRVWGYDTDAPENNVEVYVGFLRKKLRAIGSNLRIAALRCVGYYLEVCEA